MPVALTFFALFCIVAVAILLRLHWPRAGRAFHRTVLLLLGLLLLLSALNFFLKWETESEQLNDALRWTRVFSYEFAVVLFTLLRPRALTTLIAAVLTVPIFVSSVVGPLSRSLYIGTSTITPIAPGYFLQLIPWSSGPSENSGHDFIIFYQPPGLHFFRRAFVGARLYDSQCLTPHTTATINPATGSVSIHCPPLSADPAAPPSGTELDFLIPRGALSPSLSRALNR